MNIIPWFNANSGAITAIATLILVGITGWYVYLTRTDAKSRQHTGHQNVFTRP